MRRKELIKRVAAMMMAVTVVATSVSMGNTVSAYATDTVVNDRVDDLDLEKDYIGAEADCFNNIEKSNNEIAETMEKLADDAQQKANEAAQKVNELKKTIDELGVDETSMGELEKIAENAKQTAEEATEKANNDYTTASGAVGKAEQAGNTADSYNEKVINDQKNANEITVEDISSDVSDKKEAAVAAADQAEALLKVALEAENPDSTVEVGEDEKTVEEIVDMVKAEAAKAGEAADKASEMVTQKEKELSDAILQYNIYAMTYGLPLYGEKTVTYDVEKMTDEDYAALGISDETTIASIKGAQSSRESFDANVKAVNETKIEEITEEVEDAKQAAEDAIAAADKASEAVSSAKALVTNDEGTGYADIAIDAAEKTINYETNPADTALNAAKNDVETANATVEAMETALEKVKEEQEAVKSQQQSKIDDEYKPALEIINGYEEEVANNRKIVEEMEEGTGWFGLGASEIKQAEDKIEDIDDNIAEIQSKINKGYYKNMWSGKKVYYTDSEIASFKAQIESLEIQKKEPQAVVDKYNNAKNARKTAEDNIKKQPKTRKQLENDIETAEKAIQAADNVIKNAETKVSDAQKVVEEKEKIYTEKKDIYDTKVAERDAAIEEANAMLKGEATENIVNNIEKVLSQYSDGINQVEYDRELNAWANTVLKKYENNVQWSWKFWETISDVVDVQGDAKATRKFMDDEYKASYWNKLFNELGITQWAVSTAEREAVMEAIIDGYRDAMIPYEKELAIIDARFAEEMANEAKNAFDGENGYDATIAGIGTIVSDASNAIALADADISKAKNTYDEALENLNEAKEKVKDMSLSKFDISSLNAMIAEATEKLNDAKTALSVAEASKAAAETYRDWAIELVKEHISSDYAKTDDNGKFVGKDAEDYSLEAVGEEISVPYSIYRAYTQKLLENYDRATNESSIDGMELNEDKILYWLTEKNDNGNIVLTGEYVTSPKKSGTYFIGYEFKNDDGEYKVNGYMLKYTKPNPGKNPENGGNNGNNSDNNETNNGNGGTNTGANETVINTVADAGNGTGANGTGTGRGTGRLVDSVDADEEGIADLEEDAEEEKEAAPDENLEKEKESEGNKGTVEIDENETPLSATAEEESAFPWMVLVAALLLAATVVVVCASRKKVNTADAKAKIK